LTRSDGVDDDDDLYTVIEPEEEDIYADLVALKPQKVHLVFSSMIG
jgi:hypothetical protein